MHVVLNQPSIAPNTGAIIRLCANAGCDLHLVEPLGFSLDEKRVRRAGLDYHELTSVTVHTSLADAREAVPGRWVAFSAKSHRRYTDHVFSSSDVLLFGNERHGLPNEVVATFPESLRLTIPMQPGNRSLNLANAVSIVVYEAWRQVDFSTHGPGAQPTAR